jgi:hypothetical protein
MTVSSQSRKIEITLSPICSIGGTYYYRVSVKEGLKLLGFSKGRQPFTKNSNVKEAFAKRGSDVL